MSAEQGTLLEVKEVKEVKRAILELYRKRDKIKKYKTLTETYILHSLHGVGFEKALIQRGIDELHEEEIIRIRHRSTQDDRSTHKCLIMKQRAEKYLEDNR